jgi:predicted dinucleotide-binding enzyme
MQKIGILGSAIVGQTLAEGFKKHGYEVRIASRTPEKLDEFSDGSGIEAGTFSEVAAWADGVVLAVHGAAATSALELAGAKNLEGKVVIDATNPIADEAPVDGVLRFFTGPNESLMERLQASFPGAHFVKAFNSVGSARMVNPQFSAGPPTMFYCGNNDGAKKLVATVLEKFGWEPLDMGSVAAAAPIEALCQLWCIPGFRQNSWTHAFHVLRS